MDLETFLFLFGGAIELLIHLVGIPLSVVNLYVMARTSVIHPNMKFILIFQSSSLLTRGCCRFVICLFHFVLLDPIAAERSYSFPFLVNVYMFGVHTRNFMAHVLIVERVLATLFVRSYGRWRGHLFTLAWCPLTLSICLYISITSSPQRVPFPLTNLLMTAVQLVVGAVELVIFYQLCHYNSTIYQKMLHVQGYHDLSLRYQLSENIRIGKQLIPPLSLNLGNIGTAFVVLCWCYFGLPHFYWVYILSAIVGSLLGLLIEMFIITCHPYLKRDLVQILRKFRKMFALIRPAIRNNLRVAGGQQPPAAVDPTPTGAGIAQRDLISGKTLIGHSKSDQHFAILKNAWESPPVK